MGHLFWVLCKKYTAIYGGCIVLYLPQLRWRVPVRMDVVILHQYLLSIVEHTVFALCIQREWSLRQLYSLAPGKSGSDFKNALLKLVLVIGTFRSFYDNISRWMTGVKSTSVQVMAWCLTAPSHNLSQCWPRSMSPYGVTRPQCVSLCVMNLFQETWNILAFKSFLNMVWKTMTCSSCTSDTMAADTPGRQHPWHWRIYPLIFWISAPQPFLARDIPRNGA